MLLAATTMWSMAQTALSVSLPTESETGDWVVEVSMSNPDDKIMGMQFDLTIPEDFSYHMGNYSFTSRARELQQGKEMETHSMEGNEVENGGTIRVIVYSGDLFPIKGTEGVFLRINLSGLGSSRVAPCNITNIELFPMDGDALAAEPIHLKGQINNTELSCYDAMGDEVTVVGELRGLDFDEVNLWLSTNPNLKTVDLTQCTENSLGMLTLPDSDPELLLARDGQVENDADIYIKKEDGWYKKTLAFTEGAKTSVTQKRACTVGTLTYTRTWNNLNWQPLFVPFVMSYDDWKDDYDVAAINSFVGEDMDGDGVKEPSGMVLTGMSGGSLLPNVPYMIRAKATGKQTLTLTDAEVAKTAAASVVLTSDDFSYTLTGTYRQVKEMATAGYYVMAGGLLCTAANDDVTLNPYRWYLSIKDAEGNVYLVSRTSTLSVIMLEDLEDEETAIGVTEVAPTAAASGRIYDLMGRTVKADALGKGIYIINNKKVMF